MICEFEIGLLVLFVLLGLFKEFGLIINVLEIGL